MSFFPTDIYHFESGVELTLSWRDRDAFEQGVAFLEKLTGRAAVETKRNMFFLVDTTEHLHQLYDFRLALSEGAETQDHEPG